jgi:hypothetical protein
MTSPGDQVYLGSMLSQLHFWGVVSDLDTPAMMSASMECSGTEGAITLDALVGPQGVPGEPSPIVDMQWQDAAIDDVGDLPANLLDNEIDRGKAWWIGNEVYIWAGEDWMIRQMGTPGPPGPVPNITPSVELVEGTDPTQIVTSGTALNPGWLLQINKESIRGPEGDGTAIRNSADYDNSTAPDVGQAIVWNGSHYAPGDFGLLTTKMYSVPESSFTSFSAVTTRQQICAFQVPPQPFDWKPMVFGHVRVVGIELDADPLIIGCEVRIGNASAGTLVGRGFGNISTWTTIIPHFSSAQAGYDAVTPENGTALVPAYHSGTEGTVYASVFNDGAGGAYNFNKTNAQLVIMVVPVSGYQAQQGS